MQLDRGYLIVFEGIDGTGKSTQCGLLEAYLNQCGVPVVRLYEPTRGPWGMKIRNLLEKGRGSTAPEEELAWFIEDRKEDVENNIRPALADNRIVLLDRYYFSTAAYQGALGLDPQKILAENEAFAPRPDRVFLFTASAEQCLKRIEDSRGSRSAFEKRDYLIEVQRIFDGFSDPAIRRIDSEPPIETVHANLVREMQQLIPILSER